MARLTKTDLHPIHFYSHLPLGGDLDSSFTAREITDWVEKFAVFDRFVLGTHPPDFFRISTRLSAEEYLDGVATLINAVSPRTSGRVLRGIECDFLIRKKGEISFNPGRKLLERFAPDIAIIGFHFHHTLTYRGLYGLLLTDIVSALKWAIKSGHFRAIAHPFDVLDRILTEDPELFEETANLARENRVAFEINADKGLFEKPLAKLIENGNLFSFGGDLHSFSYWLKRDRDGLNVPDRDVPTVERALGLARDAADKEKLYWREMDPLFRQLPVPRPKHWHLRRKSIWLYRNRVEPERFKTKLDFIIKHFGKLEGRLIKDHIEELDSIYRRWGGEISKRDRQRIEKYFLNAPLTKNELEIYEQWLERAFELGVPKESLVNSWEDPKFSSWIS